MHPPLFVRPLTDTERALLAVGSRSSDTFVRRRCQILLASADGAWAPRIARQLGCDDQTARQAIKAFNARGLAACDPSPAAPRPVHAILNAGRIEQMRTLLHESPRAFGKPTSVWTLALAAEVAYECGITPTPLSGEAIRLALSRLGVRWQRAKRWSTNPDPAYTRPPHPPSPCISGGVSSAVT